MRNLIYRIFLAVIPLLWGCNSDDKTEKYHKTRDKVTNVKDKVVEIPMEEVLVGPVARISISKKYLVIADHQSSDKLIHIFDKQNFGYLTSTGIRGQGPGEITVMGQIVINEADGSLYVSDHGKNIIYSYNLDSLLSDAAYMPWVKVRMKQGKFFDTYDYLNDTLSIGIAIEPVGTNDFQQYISKWNMKTGEFKPVSYKHPKISKKRISYGVSHEKGLYVECYRTYDLLTIGSLDGKLKYNIYGPKWNPEKQKGTSYFSKAFFCGDKILVSYSGGNFDTEYYPNKFVVIGLDGKYLKTLDVGYRITNCAYDKENNRIVMNFNDKIQFGYLDLDGLV